MKIKPFETAEAPEWDALVARAPMGTFLHTRAFLSYHGERFADASVVVRDGDGAALGVFPAAADPGDRTRVVSHPGATFGGLVHDGSLGGARALEALGLLQAHYRDRGFERLHYAAVPSIYHRRPCADDLYALFRSGAVRVRCDLGCTVDLEDGPAFSSRRRRGLKKSRRAGVEISEGHDLLPALWPVLEENLADRHGAEPVHSFEEIDALIGRFPEDIGVVVARSQGDALAGVVLFESPRVSHAQYIASTREGNAVGALDAVFERCLARAAERATRFFDFGTSNREGGRVLNEGLYEFKSQFGGGGVAYEHYELDLGGSA